MLNSVREFYILRTFRDAGIRLDFFPCYSIKAGLFTMVKSPASMVGRHMEYPGKKSILLFQYSMYMEKHGIKSMLFHGKHGKYSMQHGKCSMFFPCFSSPFFLSFRLEKAGKFCSNTPASYFPWKSLEKHGLFTPGRSHN